MWMVPQKQKILCALSSRAKKVARHRGKFGQQSLSCKRNRRFWPRLGFCSTVKSNFMTINICNIRLQTNLITKWSCYPHNVASTSVKIYSSTVGSYSIIMASAMLDFLQPLLPQADMRYKSAMMSDGSLLSWRSLIHGFSETFIENVAKYLYDQCLSN